MENKITPEHISALIVSEHYFTAAEGIHGADMLNEGGGGDPTITDASSTSLHLLTFCVLVLKNGFTVTGESACADPKIFNAVTGRNVARQNAVSKIWQLEGYLLKQKLSELE
jgi:hypothetical protein